MSAVTDGPQRPFTWLLRHPVVDRQRHPEMSTLIRRHHGTLVDWFNSRLGYRLVVSDSTTRLLRLPLQGAVIAPRRFDPPSRRVLVLALLAAATAEDTEDVTTTQDLSDRVRALTAHDDVELAPYDPDRFAERSAFVRAVGLLVTLGTLRPVGTGTEERREGWAHQRDSIGGAYQVQRELLLRMVDPASLHAALGETDTENHLPESEARFGVMRRLLELPVCLYEDLTEAERLYLSRQRQLVAKWCHDMTGWVLEQRAEGLALIPPTEAGTDLPFPLTRAVDFAALMVLDHLLRTVGHGGGFDNRVLSQAAAGVRAHHPKSMTKELATDDAVAVRTLALLQALDLVRAREAPGVWRLTPAASRFRDPKVVVLTPRLDTRDDGSGDVSSIDQPVRTDPETLTDTRNQNEPTMTDAHRGGDV